MKYDSQQLRDLAAKVDLVDYIGQTEELHRQGQNFFIECPFHNNDNTPSLCINPVLNKWHCFGCGAGSSIYDWIMQRQSVSFPEALETVCRLAGEDIANYTESESISFLKQLKRQKAKEDSEVNVRKTLDFAEDYLNKYSDELPEEWLAEDMTAEALRTYQIRIDHNANRIVYPVFDADGCFIGIKGRTRIKAYKELGLSKYMNYNKIGTIDFFQGWQQALPYIKKKKQVIIFEGIKSCIKAWGWDMRNTVASETAALSEGQLQLLIKTGIPEVIIAWDSDQKYKDIVRDNKIQMLKRFTTVSIISDSKGWLDNKEAPVDRGEWLFRELLDRRIRL